MYRISRPPAKKRCHSNEEDIREFKEYWTEKFGMIKNLSDKTEEEQRRFISSELSKIKKQADTFMNFISGRPSINLFAASFEVSKVIAQHGKSLSDGECIMKACAPFLFHRFAEKEKIIQRIKDLSVSRRTVKDRILKLEKNTAEQLTKDLSSCKFFFYLC